MSKSKKPIQLSNDRNIHLRTTVPSHQEQLVHIGKAISSPVRLQILNLLDNTPMSIQEIASTLDIPVSSTAMHIRCLEAVSYTHLDVYKRQPLKRIFDRA